MDADSQEVERMAAAIVEHLRAHPHAADSAAGVARWWLGPAHAGVAVERVEAALDRLVALGVLRQLRLADGSVLYAPASKGP